MAANSPWPRFSMTESGSIPRIISSRCGITPAGSTARATRRARAGFHWGRPALDVVPGRNRIMPVDGHGKRDGSAVWLDHFASDPCSGSRCSSTNGPAERFGGQVFASPDGVHWSARPRCASMVGDNTTILYNPFRKKWVYSVRTGYDGRTLGVIGSAISFQGRHTGRTMNPLVPWASADELDLPDPSDWRQDLNSITWTQLLMRA